MRIAVIGGDRRFDLLSELLSEKYDAVRDPHSLQDVDVVVAKGDVDAPPGVRLITMGGSGRRGAELMQDEGFVRRNAVLSAEGAVFAAMGAAEGAIAGSRCLIIGFGRIAQALTGILQGFGAHVTVAARRAEARAQALAAGADACGMEAEALAAQAAAADLIFSTPPAIVLTEEILSAVRPGVPVIDLASAPYGVDLAAAQRLGVRAWRESGVPGRYCPAAAAALMTEYVEKMIAE